MKPQSLKESQKAEWSQANITLQSSRDQIKQRKQGEEDWEIEILSQNMLMPAVFVIRRTSPVS